MAVINAPDNYDANNERQFRRQVQDFFSKAFIKGKDIQLAKERLEIQDSVTGQRGVITVAGGVVTWTPN